MLEYIAIQLYKHIHYLTLKHLRGTVDHWELGLCVCDMRHLHFSTPKYCFWVHKKGIYVHSYGYEVEKKLKYYYDIKTNTVIYYIWEGKLVNPPPCALKIKPKPYGVGCWVGDKW